MTPHETITVELIKSQLDQVCELYKLPKYTALQSKLAANSRAVDAAKHTLKQQAERISTLEAQLAEAVGLLEEALPSIKTVANSFENTQDKWHAAFIHRIKSVIEKAREVMG